MLWAQVAQDKILAHRSATTKKKPLLKTQFQTNKVSCSKIASATNKPLFLNRMLNLEKHKRRKLWIWVVNSRQWPRKQQGILINPLTRIPKGWVRVKWVLMAPTKTLSTATSTAKKQTTDNKTVLQLQQEVELWHRNNRHSSNHWRVRMRLLLSIWIALMLISKFQRLIRKHNQDIHLRGIWINQEGSILNIITLSSKLSNLIVLEWEETVGIMQMDLLVKLIQIAWYTTETKVTWILSKEDSIKVA